MSLTALFSARPFYQHPQSPRFSLVERIGFSNVGFVSIGPGGVTLASIKTTKSGPVVTKQQTRPQPANNTDFPALARELQKLLPLSFGPRYAIVGISHKLEWHVKRGLDYANVHTFIHDLRNEPAKILGTPSDNITYMGTYQESSLTGLAFGVGSMERELVIEALTAAGFIVVRPTIPMLSVLNLLLGDERVVRGELTPLVIDQGYAVALTTNDRGWGDIQARQICGPGMSITALGELVERIKEQNGSAKFLAAISPANGGAPIEETLVAAGAHVENFSVSNIESENLFPYATALF